MTDADQRFDRLEAVFDKIDRELQELRVVEEGNAQQIKMIAEVQSHQGTVLEQLVKDVEPLKILLDLLRTVIQDHERRITALEKRP